MDKAKNQKPVVEYIVGRNLDGDIVEKHFLMNDNSGKGTKLTK